MPQRAPRTEGKRNDVGLIVYADRLGGTLPGLATLLDGPLAGLFGAVHVLPFYERYDGADAGFDPEDHTAVDARLGDWEDVRALAGRVEVVADLIVNHVSVRSPAFREFLARPATPGRREMFLTLDAVFPGGATEAELLALTRPRPSLPFTAVRLADGTRRLMWTTFTAEQVDLDVGHPDARAHLTRVLGRLAAAGVAVVRLDAVGYAVKTRGTTSFMTPATLAFVDELIAEAHALGLEVLVEVHGHHALQAEIATHADWVYDFALPPLVLHALFTADAGPLVRWLAVRPANAVTVLDTHDGIGVVDVADLLSPAQIDALVEGIAQRTRGVSRRATGGAAANVDLYQVNSTFYDALGRDDDAYVIARLLQLFTPGRPQVYYVGLLAGVNDEQLLERTGVGRDVNRHVFAAEEIEAALALPVVQAVCAAIRLRAAHPAFAGTCAVSGGADGAVELAWTAADASAVTLAVQLDRLAYTVTLREPGGSLRTVADIRDLGA